MLIKKLSRIFAISVIAFLAVLLWNTKSSQADESSKLLNSAAIQKTFSASDATAGCWRGSIGSTLDFIILPLA